MSSKPNLPELDLRRFREELSQLLPLEIPERAFSLLFEHYEELRKWNPRLSLIGPGTIEEILSRHYAESLTALPFLLPDEKPSIPEKTLVDLGSGGGFPGFVLAATLPDLQVTLIEPRQRKWAFLNTAIRRCGLSCKCLDVRVDSPLPAGFPDDIDLITSRALMIPAKVFQTLVEHSERNSGRKIRFLLWTGEKIPDLPDSLEVRREIRLPGSRFRRIVEIY